jgi:hypothetical protein
MLYDEDRLFEYKTRQTIQLLQEMYFTGAIKSHNNNTVTTESCNYMVQQLLDQINIIAKSSASSSSITVPSNDRAQQAMQHHVIQRQLLTQRAYNTSNDGFI